MSSLERDSNQRIDLIDNLIALFESGRAIEAQIAARQLVDLWPEDAECWRNYAFIVSRNGDSETEKVLRQALKLNPDSVVILRHLGRVLATQGKLSDAVDYLKQAVEIDHQCSEILFEYASIQFQLQDFEGALTSFYGLIQLNSRILDAYRGAISCQLKLQKISEAIELCNLGLMHFPNSAVLYRQSADLFMHHKEFTSAVVAYRNAITHGDISHICYLNLGIALKNCGEFSESLVFLKIAVNDLLTQLPLSSTSVDRIRRIPTQKKIQIDFAKQVLLKLKELFELHQIRWCLIAGTLLGVYRDGDLIRGDKDIDIAMPIHIDREWLKRILLYDGEFDIQSAYGEKHQQNAKYSLTIKHTKTDICVDVFFLEPVDDTSFLMGIDHPGQAILSRLSKFEFGWWMWQAESWPVPSNIEKYLLETYGERWSEPNPLYDTIISHPCRIAEAIPVVLCYGYAKLYADLLDKKWRHARAYTEQLLLRQDDMLLHKVREQCSLWIVNDKEDLDLI
jgi:tetratricopeptide (TPR) repeat protein